MPDETPSAPPAPAADPLPPAVLMTGKPPVKPGWQTTEFWSHACVIVWAVAGAVTGVLPGKAAIIAAGIATGAYAISRALTKVGGSL